MLNIVIGTILSTFLIYTTQTYRKICVIFLYTFLATWQTQNFKITVHFPCKITCIVISSHLLEVVFFFIKPCHLFYFIYMTPCTTHYFCVYRTILSLFLLPMNMIRHVRYLKYFRCTLLSRFHFFFLKLKYPHPSPIYTHWIPLPTVISLSFVGVYSQVFTLLIGIQLI